MSNGVQKKLLEKWGWGCYPAGYDRAVHGPYDPARFYGPKDTPFGEVKISELAKWLARRDKTPRAVAGAISRARFRWIEKFVEPRRAKVAPFFQFVVLSSTFFYVAQWKTLRHHKTRKYHW